MSETKKLKLFKHDSPETNENQFDIETSLNENWDKIDEHFGENRKRIIELEAEKQRLKEDLKGLPTGTFSDESIHLKDSADMRLHELKINGNSKQETRSGKNLLKFTKSAFPTQIINGLTITNNDDGSFTLNGTTTDIISVSLSQTMKDLKAGTYYLSRNEEGTVSSSFTNILYGNNGSAENLCTLATEGQVVITNIDYENYYLWLYIKSGITFTNYILKPQLEEGSVATEYELYGVSPSPEYPSEVKCCDDNVNLFDKDTGIKRSKYIGANGEIVNDVNLFYQENYIKVFPNTSYVISAKNGEAFRIAEYDSNKDFIKRTYNVNSISNKFNIVTSENCYFIRLSCNINNLDSIKFEQNSTPTPYSKYGQGNVNIEICNKNLATPLDGLWYSNILEEFIVDSTGHTYIAKVKPNSTITVSKKNEGNRFVIITSENKIIANSNYSRIIIAKSETNIKEYTFTTNEKENYIFFGYYKGTEETQKEITKEEIQIEISDTKTNYIEHKTQEYIIPMQNPLMKIEDYEDTFIKRDGKWFEKHCIYRYVFNGTENITITNSGTENWFYNYSTNKSALENPFPLCSHYKSNNIFTTNTNQGIFITLNGNIRIREGEEKTIEEFKTWLSEQYNTGKPVYVDYVLKNSEDVECTAEQSEILNKIENEAKTYKGITHIYSTDEISPNFDGIYFKDIEMMIQGGK